MILVWPNIRDKKLPILNINLAKIQEPVTQKVVLGFRTESKENLALNSIFLPIKFRILIQGFFQKVRDACNVADLDPDPCGFVGTEMASLDPDPYPDLDLGQLK